MQFEEEGLEGFNGGAGGHSKTVSLRHANGTALPRRHAVRKLQSGILPLARRTRFNPVSFRFHSIRSDLQKKIQLTPTRNGMVNVTIRDDVKINGKIVTPK